MRTSDSRHPHSTEVEWSFARFYRYRHDMESWSHARNPLHRPFVRSSRPSSTLQHCEHLIHLVFYGICSEPKHRHVGSIPALERHDDWVADAELEYRWRHVCRWTARKSTISRGGHAAFWPCLWSHYRRPPVRDGGLALDILASRHLGRSAGDCSSDILSRDLRACNSAKKGPTPPALWRKPRPENSSRSCCYS